MAYTTLIDTNTLAAHLDEANWAIVDCRFVLDDPAWGEHEYTHGHVPGAVYAHLDRDLSGPATGTNGRHPLPEIDQLRATFGRLGIGAGTQVIAYDQDSGAYASRLWWLLRWLGHDEAAVLDGGWAKWLEEGRTVESGARTALPRQFEGAPRAGWVVTAGEVAPMIGRPEWRLLDARAGERYRGEVEPIDRVPGHIPGATNRPFKSNLGEGGVFRSPGELREAFLDAAGGAAIDHVVCYCGSGVTACHNLLAMEHAGLTGAKLYAGSWSEWSSDPNRPVERG
jgi:thiosulfate/3-mercaptopyruvate sulfurtransferase